MGARLLASFVVACLAALVLVAGCTTAPPTSGDSEAGAIGTAEAQLAARPTTAASYYLPTSLEGEVARSPVIVVGMVAEVGPTFNGARSGDGLQYRPDP